MVVEKLAENVLHILTHPHMNLSKTTDKGSPLGPPENQLFYDRFFSWQSGNANFRNFFSRRAPGPPCWSPGSCLPCRTTGPAAGCDRQWRRPGSNRQPPACKAGALPVELRPRDRSAETRNPNIETRNTRPSCWTALNLRTSAPFRISGFALRISPKEWARVDSDYRPHAYQACALTN
jgi:hypothetical protein